MLQASGHGALHGLNLSRVAVNQPDLVADLGQHATMGGAQSPSTQKTNLQNTLLQTWERILNARSPIVYAMHAIHRITSDNNDPMNHGPYPHLLDIKLLRRLSAYIG
jgi:hypothetical protein